MSKPQQLQNNVEFVRCNQRILRETHPDLYEHFSKIHEKVVLRKCVTSCALV